MGSSSRYALAADDDPLIRMEMRAILTEAGFEVFTARHVEDALKVLVSHGHQLDLLLTDVQMPPGTLTGYDLAWRCARDWPRIGILVASGARPPQPGDLPQGALFLSKPFTADMVRSGIARIAAGR